MSDTLIDSQFNINIEVYDDNDINDIPSPINVIHNTANSIIDTQHTDNTITPITIDTLKIPAFTSYVYIIAILYTIYISQKTYTIPSNPGNTPLFPTSFSITTHDTSVQSSFSASIMNDTATPDITCYYDDAFETVVDAVNDNTSLGVEYLLFLRDIKPEIEDGPSKRTNLDVIIKRECIKDTTTNPTSSPSSEPTIEPTMKPTTIIQQNQNGNIVIITDCNNNVMTAFILQNQQNQQNQNQNLYHMN